MNFVVSNDIYEPVIPQFFFFLLVYNGYLLSPCLKHSIEYTSKMLHFNGNVYKFSKIMANCHFVLFFFFCLSPYSFILILYIVTNKQSWNILLQIRSLHWHPYLLYWNLYEKMLYRAIIFAEPLKATKIRNTQKFEIFQKLWLL